MTDLLSLAVALICLGAIYSKHIPTGVLGSAGLLAISVAALVAIGDHSFANVDGGHRRRAADRLPHAGGARGLMVYRSKTGNVTPRRALYRLGGGRTGTTTIIQQR